MTSMFYLLPIAGLLIGFAMGWIFKTRQARRSSVSMPLAPVLAIPASTQMADRPTALAISTSTAIREAEVQQLQLELVLAGLHEEIAALQAQISTQEQEQTRLLYDLDHKSVSAKGAIPSADAGDISANRRKTEDILSLMSDRVDEIDALQEMHDSFQIRIDRLTQQVQRQDDELHMMYQTLRAKTEEINEAQALLDRRDSEQEIIIRQRTQRERDIAREKNRIQQMDEELQRLLQDSATVETENQVVSNNIAVDSGTEQIIIPPTFLRSLPDGMRNHSADDLTEILGLGRLYADQLQLHGIETFDHLARSRPEDIQRMLEIPGHFSPDIRRWIATANQIVATRRNKTQNVE